jgi:hypothetical protein
LLSEKLHAVQIPQSDGSGLRVTVHDVRLAAHFCRLERNNVEDGSVG